MNHLGSVAPKSFLAPVVALLTVLLSTACGPSAESPVARTEGSAVEPIHIDGLGALWFPNSGSPEAQDAFRRGVLLLHSFEYEPAAEAFRKAQAIDPEFALAYWGEAMTYNHPLWREYDRARAVSSLENLAPTPEERRAKAPTEREKMYLDAVETLYAERFSADASKPARDRAYMDAMERLHEAYPEDDEARSFYALSILGSVDGSRDFATYMRAAATALPVFGRNPQHPGAAHYIIHSFDDPVHAPLGLPAAEVYAEVAPGAAHAQHMTSHIFVAMGLWERVVEANIRARDTQDGQRAEAGMRPNVCGHYSSWLHYGHLQLGATDKAEALMALCHERVQSEPTAEEWIYFAAMRSRHVVDTEDWKLIGRWTVSSEDLPSEQIWGEGHPAASLTYGITNALAMLELGDDSAARALVREPRPEDPMAALQVDQLAGLLALRDGNTDQGLALLRSAAEAEAALPFQFGPPVPVKPTYELLGEALASLGDREAAAEAFRQAVKRTPGRTLAVSGLEATSGE
jgi:tetratricopeptide (TPR) repeat protein